MCGLWGFEFPAEGRGVELSCCGWRGWLVLGEIGREEGGIWVRKGERRGERRGDGERHTTRDVCGGNLDPRYLSVGDHFEGRVCWVGSVE